YIRADDGGVPPLPPGMSYLDVAISGYHSVLRRSDGAAVGCTAPPNEDCNPPALPPGLTYVEISAYIASFIPPTCSISVARRSDGRHDDRCAADRAGRPRAAGAPGRNR